jgi:predicted membrane channel-forming protein YqfA (hemolysin III family)
MGIGSIFFFLAIDEFKDYLRLYHGIWHFCIGSSSFFTWQAKQKTNEEIKLVELFSL